MTAAAPAFAASSTPSERIGRLKLRRAFQVQPMGGRAHDRDLGRIHAAHLTGTHAENLIGEAKTIVLDLTWRQTRQAKSSA